jgi:hypothetical protein
MAVCRALPELVLIEDVVALRRKLGAASGDLARYWRNYLELAGSEPIGEFQALPPLAWLVTGEARYAHASQAVFRELLRVLPLADVSIEAQMHAYTAGAPLARFAVFLDWLWDSEVLTAAERQALAAGITEQVYSHCFLRLQGRVPAGDNQQMSMAFACAVTGYVFGVKRGASPAARRMYAEGLARYESLLASLGDGGWCGEGSTYHHQVLCPVLALFTALVEQVTGVPSFDRRVGAATVREALTLAVDTVNRAGMLPGWDQYGNCAPELKTSFVYLARQTGSAAPLAAIAEHGMWSENEILAWYNDDKVWSLVLWPDQPPAVPPAPPRSWLNPPVGGKLLAGELELLQYWDLVEAGRPGRAHLNPNCVELCSHGALHTADGHGPTADPSFFACPDGLSFAQAHSVVLVDDRGYEYPNHPWHGRGEWLVSLPGLEALCGDVSDLYDELWQVRTMQRTALLLGERLVLLHDRFAAAAPHRFTWQLMLRPSVTVAGCQARQRLREGVVLDLATTPELIFDVRQIKDYPRGMEQRAQRLALASGPAAAGEFVVALRPHPGTVTVRDLSADWSVVHGGPDVPEALFTAPATTDLHRDYLGPAAPGQSQWFGQRCFLTADEAAQAERLSIARGQVDRLEAYVNGVRAPELFDHPSLKPGCADVQKPDGRFWPSHYDVRGLLRAGENRLAIASAEFRGQSVCGPIRLLRLVAPPAAPLALERDGESLVVSDGDARWLVLPANSEHRPCAVGDATTDATLAVRQGEHWRAAFATGWQSPALTLRASARVHLALTANGLWVDTLGQPATVLTLTLGTTTHTARLAAPPAALGPWPLTVVDSTPPPPITRPAPPPVADLGAAPPLPLCAYDEGLLAGAAADRRAALTAALAAPNWRTRVGACEALLPADGAWAVPLLLDLLAAEAREQLYPPITANWPFAKMKTTFLGWPRGDEPEAGKRRYRLKTVIFQALGRLGDLRAEAAIRAQLRATEDLYPVTVQAVLAAAQLQLRSALPELTALTQNRERNTRECACHTLALFAGELSWPQFARLVTPTGALRPVP